MIPLTTSKKLRPMNSMNRVAFVYFCWVRQKTAIATKRMNMKKMTMKFLPPAIILLKTSHSDLL